MCWRKKNSKTRHLIYSNLFIDPIFSINMFYLFNFIIGRLCVKFKVTFSCIHLGLNAYQKLLKICNIFYIFFNKICVCITCYNTNFNWMWPMHIMHINKINKFKEKL